MVIGGFHNIFCTSTKFATCHSADAVERSRNLAERLTFGLWLRLIRLLELAMLFFTELLPVMVDKPLPIEEFDLR